MRHAPRSEQGRRGRDRENERDHPKQRVGRHFVGEQRADERSGERGNPEYDHHPRHHAPLPPVRPGGGEPSQRAHSEIRPRRDQRVEADRQHDRQPDNPQRDADHPGYDADPEADHPQEEQLYPRRLQGVERKGRHREHFAHRRWASHFVAWPPPSEILRMWARTLTGAFQPLLGREDIRPGPRPSSTGRGRIPGCGGRSPGGFRAWSWTPCDSAPRHDRVRVPAPPPPLGSRSTFRDRL